MRLGAALAVWLSNVEVVMAEGLALAFAAIKPEARTKTVGRRWPRLGCHAGRAKLGRFSRCLKRFAPVAYRLQLLVCPSFLPFFSEVQ